MRTRIAAGLLIALIVAATGCITSNDPTSPGATPDEPKEAVIDLNSPTGGFTYADEEPAFGEPEIYRDYDNETAYEDPYREEKQVRDMERRHGARVYRFRAIWGHLINAYEDTTTSDYCGIDWTGTLQMEGGIVIVERIIAFENDEHVRRIDRSTIEWVSRTGPHVDGIQVKLICPPPQPDDTLSNVAPDPEPILTIKTGPYAEHFTLEQLAAMQFVHWIDRCGNGISINSHIIPPYCPHGHLMGRYRGIEPDTILSADSTEVRGIVHGIFRGVWFGERGRPVGHLKGVYGVNSAGESVFFGKYIDQSGRFAGILRGHYGPSPSVEAVDAITHGWFEGVWIGRNEEVKGRLKGHWATDQPGHGFFHGIWGMNCSTTM